MIFTKTVRNCTAGLTFAFGLCFALAYAYDPGRPENEGNRAAPETKDSVRRGLPERQVEVHDPVLEAVYHMVSARLHSPSNSVFIPGEEIIGVGTDVWFVAGLVDAPDEQGDLRRFQYSLGIKAKKDCPSPSSTQCWEIIKKMSVKSIEKES